MALSILNNVAALQAENQISNTQSSLQKTLSQLSSGSRISSGADDAAGLSIADGIHANIQALNQSSRNASDGVGKLQVADGALSQVTSLLNRAVTLATEAATGTLNGDNGTQRTALDAEFTAIKQEISRIGTNTSFNGTAVFGSTNVNQLESGASGLTLTTALGVTTGGGSLVIAAGGQNYTFTAAGTTTTYADGVHSSQSNLYASTALTGGSVTITYGAAGSTGSLTFTFGAGNTVQTLLNDINNAGVGLQAQLSTSGQLQVFDTQSRAAISMSATNAATPAAGDAAEVLQNYTTDNAAQTLTTGSVTTATSSTVGDLINKINNAGDGFQASLSSAGKLTITDSLNRGDIAVANTTDTALTGASGVLGGITNPASTATDPNQLHFATSLGGSAAAALSQAITVGGSLAFSVGGSTFTYNVANGATLASLVNNINSDTHGLKASVDSTGHLNITDSLNRGNVAVANSSTLTALGAASNPTGSNSGSLSVFLSDSTGIGTSLISVNLGALSSSNINGISLSSDSLLTQTGAQSALSDINSAVSAIAALRGTIGAGINRLQAASSVMTTQVQNLTTAEDSIRSSDVSQNVADMTKYNILNQTGISALSQANQMQQGVLKLLQ